MIQRNQLRTGLLAVGLVSFGIAAFAWNSNAGEGCKASSATKASVQATSEGGCGAKATQASTGSCGAKATQASTGGCSAKATQASAGSCGAKATATQASAGSCDMKATQASAGAGCCASKGAATQASNGGSCATTQSTMAASFPTDTKITRVVVPGGVDMIFTSSDLATIENTISATTNACNAAGRPGDCGARTCAVSRVGNSVVLSLRGENAEGCCAATMGAGMVQTSGAPGACTSTTTTSGAGGACDTKAAPSRVKKIVTQG